MIKYNLIITVFLTLWLFACENSDEHFEDYFVKYYGGEGSQQGVALEVTENGFYCLGNTIVEDVSHLFLLRSDLKGNQLWEKTLEGTETMTSVDFSVDAEGLITVVANYINNGQSDIIIYRLDAQANKLDSLVYGSTAFSESAVSLTPLDNGDFIIMGSSTEVDTNKPGYNADTDKSDIFSIKITNNLELYPSADWRKIYGFPGVDQGVKIIERNATSFWFYGTTDRPANANTELKNNNSFLFAASQGGLPLSNPVLRLFGTANQDEANDVIMTQSGDVVLLGTNVNGTSSHLFFTRLLSNGVQITSKVILDNRNLGGVKLAEGNDGNFIVLAESASADSNLVLLKVDGEGNDRWIQNFGGLEADVAADIQVLEDGSIMVLGTINLQSQTKILLAKVTPSGELKY